MTSMHVALLHRCTNVISHADIVVVPGRSACLRSAVNNWLVIQKLCPVVQKLLILVSRHEFRIRIWRLSICVKPKNCDVPTFSRAMSLHHCYSV